MRALAVALCLVPAAARAGEPGVRRVFRLEGERGEVAFRDDRVTLFSTAAPQSVRLAGARAEPTAAHLARADAHRPGLCDPLDQLDLAGTDPGLRAALPPAAKVKRVLAHGGREVAVYSLPGERRYYETWVALLERAHDGTRLLEMKRISEGSGTFCGAHPLGPGHLLVLVEGEAGGREVLVAYGLAIVP